MKKPPVFAALFLAIVFTAPAHAQDIGVCDSYPEVPVHITPLFEKPRYDFTKNLAELQTIGHDPGRSIPQYHALAMGITRYSPVLEFHMPIEVETANGTACARVKKVDVTIGYRDVTIFIASEIPQGSCDFSESMAHEQKHIAVNRDILREFAPRIEAEVKSYMRLYGAFRVPKAEDAEPYLRGKLDMVINNVIAEMEQENMRRQQLVDSRSEYDRLAHVCGGELSRIAGRYRENGP